MEIFQFWDIRNMEKNSTHIVYGVIQVVSNIVFILVEKLERVITKTPEKNKKILSLQGRWWESSWSLVI